LGSSIDYVLGSPLELVVNVIFEVQKTIWTRTDSAIDFHVLNSAVNIGGGWG